MWSINHEKGLCILGLAWQEQLWSLKIHHNSLRLPKVSSSANLKYSALAIVPDFCVTSKMSTLSWMRGFCCNESRCLGRNNTVSSEFHSRSHTEVKGALLDMKLDMAHMRKVEKVLVLSSLPFPNNFSEHN